MICENGIGVENRATIRELSPGEHRYQDSGAEVASLTVKVMFLSFFVFVFCRVLAR